MQVWMNATITGKRDGVAWPAKGEPIDLPDDEAATLLRQRMVTSEPPTTDAEPDGEQAAADASAPESETTDAAPDGEQAVATPKRPRARKPAAEKR